MANDIDIKAGLGRTTASGPAAPSVPSVNVERYQPLDVYSAAKQLQGLFRGFGGGQQMWNGAPGPRQGGGFGVGTSALLPGAGAKSQMPMPSYSGAGMSSAPQLQALQGYRSEPVRPPTYATPLGTPGLDVVYGGDISTPSYLGTFEDFANRSGAFNSQLGQLQQAAHNQKPVKRPDWYGTQQGNS